MKFRDLLFLEQDDWGNNIDPDQPEDNDDINNPPLPADDPGGDDPDVPEEPQEPRPPKPKKLSMTQQTKKKWKEESPALTEFEMEEHIAFFRARKDNLRPYHPFGYQENNRHWINLPEVAALVLRFPAMTTVLSQNDKMKDIRNYPWEVMQFYMENVQATAVVIDEENLVPGFKIPWEEQLERSKEIWNATHNKVIDENGIKVFKIESKHESVQFGSIQRVLNQWRWDKLGLDARGQRKPNPPPNIPDLKKGNAFWCITVPLNSPDGRGNMWTTYRPENAFYFIWDANRPDGLTEGGVTGSENYCGSIQHVNNGSWTFVDLYNHTTSDLTWDDIVRKYPILEGKEEMFPHFGTTSKERVDRNISNISMQEGSSNFFGTQPDSDQYAYVDSGRHVNNLAAFGTMRPRTRKHYVAKTTLENGDAQRRFTCSDPNNEFGILEFLRLQTKPDNLYKMLDVAVLQHQLGVEEGVLALKKLIIGTNWIRGLSDDDKNITLISKREAGRMKMGNIEKRYGLINTETADIEEMPEYVEVPGLLQSFVQPIVDENGKLRAGEKYMMRKYVHKHGDGNMDNTRGFYFFLNKNALHARGENGEIPADYLKGKYFTLEEGEAYIQSKLGTGELRRM